MNDKPWILFVDDDDNDVLLMRRACEAADLDYQVVALEDSRKAIERLEQAVDAASRGEPVLPKLILLDLKLIGSSGFEVLEWLKNNPALRRQVPVLIFSSSWVQADVSRAMELGADDYIVKPNSFQELVQVCRKIAEWAKSGPRSTS
jgi:CheY-like chemotaxis protein